MRERKKPSQSWIGKSIEEIEKEAFNKGQEAGFAKICDKLRELKSGYESDLDAVPRFYERDIIQLCAKISLIERLILELKEEQL